MKRFMLGAALGALAWCSAAAQENVQDRGQDATQNSASKAGEIVLAGSFDEITVYATRNPISAFSYPGQVTVIGRDVIDDFNPSSVFDIFDATPGAQFQGGPRRSGQTPSIRGVEGEGVLVLFDGARQSFLSGHDGRLFIDPDLVQAVEVIRGPTSALYGSGALGGVIALRTITAEGFLADGETAAVKISAGYQSVNDEARAAAVGAWRSEDGKVDIVANLTRRTSGNIDLGNGFTLPADDEILSSLLKTTARVSDDITLTASWIRFGGASTDPNNPQGANVASAGNGNVFRDIDSNTLQGTLNFNPSKNDLIDLNLTGYYTRNEVAEDEVDTTRAITREVDTLGVTLDNRSKFSLADVLDLTLTYGGEFYRDEQIGRDNTTADGTRGGVPDATAKFYGAFVQAEATWKKPFGAPGALTIIPGVRWDKFESDAVGQSPTDDNAVSPKIGVSYQPVEAVLIFGNWAESFRAPSFNEIYADNLHFQIPNFSVPGPFVPFGPPAFVSNFFIPNTGLQPEESTTWEVGAGLDLDNVLFEGDTLSLKGSYYESDIDNLIDLDVQIPFTCFLTPAQLPPFAPPCGSGAPFGNTSQNVNVTNAAIDGVEIEAEYDSDYVYLRGNYGAINGGNKDTNDFVGVLTPDILFLDGGVKWPAEGVRLGARVTIGGDFEEVNDAALARDSYAVGDIYLVWEPTTPVLNGFRVDLGIDNVTNTDYQIVAAGVSEPGRNFKAAISWRKGF